MSFLKQDRSSDSADTVTYLEQDRPRTDWLAWSLQLALGCVVGFGAGFRVARLMFDCGFVSFDQMFLVMVGGALGCGAFASYYGDRAWMSPSIFDPPGPPITEPGRKWSKIIGGFGGALVFAPVAIHLMTDGWPSSGSSSSEFSLFTLALAAVLGLLLFHALRTGTGFSIFGTIDRVETPMFFWIYVFALAIGMCCLLFGR